MSLPSPVQSRWVLFALGAAVAVAGLAWVTRAVLSLEQDQATARAERAQAERIRLALWRLDSWMAPRLAAEASRPYFHYLPLYPPRRAYDQHLQPIGVGEVLTPSPLLGFQDDVVLLHVQVDATGRVTSPQVLDDLPWTLEGSLPAAAQFESELSEERRAQTRELLHRARRDLGEVPLVSRVEEMIACQAMVMADDPQSEAPFVSDLLAKLGARLEGRGGVALGRARDFEPGRVDLDAGTIELYELSAVEPTQLARADSGPREGLTHTQIDAGGGGGSAGRMLTQALERGNVPDAVPQAQAHLPRESSASEDAARPVSPSASTKDQAGATPAPSGKEALAAANGGLPPASASAPLDPPPGASRAAPSPGGPPPSRASPPSIKPDPDVRSRARGAPPTGSLSVSASESAPDSALATSTGAAPQAPTASPPAPPILAPGSTPSSTPSVPPQQAALSFDNDYAKRLIQSNVAQDVGQQRGQWAAPAQVASGLDEPPVEVGPFVPLWVSHTDAPPSLYYFRRVAVGSAELMQGFLVDWSKLCELLRQQIADLVAGATIEAVGVGGEGGAPSTSGAALVANVADASDTRLATIPARLAAKPCEPISAANGLTPARATLGAAWLALLAAIVAAGVSLHATAADAARRARFAGAVTHELRTPLTTFQLYTDMLVDDMVPPERRAEYLETLRDESQRLGHLVENVLSYARIEQGRYAARLEPTPVADLMARVVQPLQRRADSAGLTLRMDNALADPNRLVTTDPESVERILFNLVDNAAKYASGGADPVAADTGVLTLRLDEAAGDASRIRISVVDHGPGVSTTQAARLFQPFERGSDDHTQQQRGIGLGLALSRELARAIGGDLMHAPTPGGGATFTLALPA